MNRSMTLSALTAGALLATTAVVTAQQSPTTYVDVGGEFRQSNQVTMGSNLLTPEEQSRFDAMRQQAKTTAEKDRVEAEESALLNQRVSERISSALSQPVSPGAPGTAERPGTNGMEGSGSR